LKHPALSFVALFVWLSFVPIARAQTEPGKLLEGPMTTAIDTLTAQLKENSLDDQKRFALGMAQSLHAVETLSASLYAHGMRAPKGLGDEVPIFNIPVPENPDPKETTIEDVDAMIGQFVADLQTAQKTLAMVQDPNFKLPVRIGMIQLDLNGAAEGGQTHLWEIGALTELASTKDQAETFEVHFDLGDARWLEGYTHLLCAIGEMYLAYDKHELFDATGHLFFAKPKSAGAQLGDFPKDWDVDGTDIVDVIAFIHCLHLPVKDPAKMAAAREDLLAMIADSRASWAAILKETDDDHEWLPNPNQTNIITNVKVTQEVVDKWLAFLNDCEDALNGKKLIPFWRSKEDGTGINLKRVFTEPRLFDLVMWVQGTAALPYLEKGELTTGANMEELDQMLEGDLFLFSIWVN
jgi:hypothetical protein